MIGDGCFHRLRNMPGPKEGEKGTGTKSVAGNQGITHRERESITASKRRDVYVPKNADRLAPAQKQINLSEIERYPHCKVYIEKQQSPDPRSILGNIDHISTPSTKC